MSEIKYNQIGRIKKSHLLIAVIFCLVIIISCKKVVNNTSNPPPAAKIDRPIKVLQTQYTPNQIISEKSIYTFPDTTVNKIVYDRLDSFYSDIYFTFSAKSHTEYDFDPVTKHLLTSSSRTAELFGNNPLSTNINGNWDNIFDFSSHNDYPDTITTINYTNYLMTSQYPGFKFSPDRLYPGVILYDQNLNSTLSYQIILNDSGAVHLIDTGSSTDPNNNIISYKYYLDSADDCRRLLIQKGFILEDPSLNTSYFQPTTEIRSTYTYDNNSDEIKQLLGTVMNATDLYWNRIAVRYSQTLDGKEPYYYFRRLCRSYSDSAFIVSGNSYSFSSATTYQNEIVKDQKGRISSLIYKNGSGGLIEVFDFIYAN